MRHVNVVSKEDLHRRVREFLMQVDMVLFTDQTLEQALKVIQKGKIGDRIFYFYVTDRTGHLKGVISTRSLVLNQPHILVGKAMDETFAFLHADQTLREAMHAIEKHRLLALPVVDDQFRFLGIIDIEIYFDDTIKKIDGLMRKDIFQFIGLKIEEGKINTPWKGYRLRMPWLLCNVASGLICAVIVRAFEVVLAKLLVLAMFIPLVLTLCESVSMQAMTQSLAILRTNRIMWTGIQKRIWLEVKTVLFLSLTCAIGVGALSWFWEEGGIPVFEPIYTIGTALFIAIIMSAVVGMTIPVILRVCKLDPKLASGPVILMIVDVIATTIYFGMAYVWVR